MRPDQPLTHFRVWMASNKPYNLCDGVPGAPRTTPHRSLVTCPECLERLR